MDLSIIGRAISKRTPKSLSKWKPPDEGVLKMNVDARFSMTSHEGALGLVLREHEVSLIRRHTIWYCHAANALITESSIVRDGIKLAFDLGMSRIDVEMYSNEVVKLLNDRANGRSEIALVLQKIEELSGNMEYFHLSSIGWEANEEAHLCAKEASSSRCRCLWINYASCLSAE
jgi:hypothetical protein